MVYLFIILTYLLARIGVFMFYDHKVSKALIDLGVKNSWSYGLCMFETKKSIIFNPFKWSFDKLATTKQKNIMKIREKYHNQIVEKKYGKPMSDEILNALADKRLWG